MLKNRKMTSVLVRFSNGARLFFELFYHLLHSICFTVHKVNMSNEPPFDDDEIINDYIEDEVPDEYNDDYIDEFIEEYEVAEDGNDDVQHSTFADPISVGNATESVQVEKADVCPTTEKISTSGNLESDLYSFERLVSFHSVPSTRCVTS